MFKRPKPASTDEKGAILLATCLLLLMALFVLKTRWGDIRGSYLQNPDLLLKTNGAIVSSRVSGGSPNSRRLHYEIWYEYQVNGRKYRSDQITFSYRGDVDPQFARTYVRKYLLGRSVTVYYDRNDPSFAVLEPQVTGFYRAVLIAPIILGLLVLAELIWLLSTRSNGHSV